MGVPKDNKGVESIFKEIMAENSSNMNSHLHETHISPKRFNTKTVSRRIIIKLSKIKDKKNFKSIMRKQSHHIQGNSYEDNSGFLIIIKEIYRLIYFIKIDAKTHNKTLAN